MSHNMIRRILEGSRKATEGKDVPGKRDGTGPFKGSAQASISKVGRRKAAGEPCPADEDSELQVYATEPPGAMGEDAGDYDELLKGIEGGPAHPKPKTPEEIDRVIKALEMQLEKDKARNKHPGIIRMVQQELDHFKSMKKGSSPDMECEVSDEEMESICPECAKNMREHNIVGIRLRYLLEAGILEVAGDGEDGVLLEKEGDGWPKKLKKGRFSEYCKREGHDGPSVACARKAMRSGDKSVRGMASFYMNTVKPGGKTASAVGDDEE